MRIVALEEHVSFQQFVREIDPHAIAERGYDGRSGPSGRAAELDDVERRLASMDDAGITTQVLSVIGPGADLLSGDAGPDLARRYNDRVAAVVRAHPDRFAAFAHLPLSVPAAAAADELERAVRELGFVGVLLSGHTGGKFLDDRSFEPLLARAEALDVPIYLHPGIPPAAVRNAYYDGFEPLESYAFATSGWGWHAETAVHVLRMVLSGALDRHPKLRLIVGHMGEGLPAMMERCDDVFGRLPRFRQRNVSAILLDHLVVTTAGFFALAPFMTLLMTFGVDRILFSVDYPFASNERGRRFIDTLPLSEPDKEKIAHGNADRLLKLRPAVAP